MCQKYCFCFFLISCLFVNYPSICTDEPYLDQQEEGTSVTIGAQKCGIPAFLGNYNKPTDGPTIRPANKLTELRAWWFIGKLHFK